MPLAEEKLAPDDIKEIARFRGQRHLLPGLAKRFHIPMAAIRRIWEDPTYATGDVNKEPLPPIQHEFTPPKGMEESGGMHPVLRTMLDPSHPLWIPKEKMYEHSMEYKYLKKLEEKEKKDSDPPAEETEPKIDVIKSGKFIVQPKEAIEAPPLKEVEEELNEKMANSELPETTWKIKDYAKATEKELMNRLRYIKLCLDTEDGPNTTLENEADKITKALKAKGVVKNPEEVEQDAGSEDSPTPPPARALKKKDGRGGKSTGKARGSKTHGRVSRRKVDDESVPSDQGSSPDDRQSSEGDCTPPPKGRTKGRDHLSDKKGSVARKEKEGPDGSRPRGSGRGTTQRAKAKNKECSKANRSRVKRRAVGPSETYTTEEEEDEGRQRVSGPLGFTRY